MLRPSPHLGWRLAIIGTVLILEAVLHTVLFQSGGQDVEGSAAFQFRELQHAIFRCLVAYVVFCVLLTGLTQPSDDADPTDIRLQPAWFAAHALFLGGVVGISIVLHELAIRSASYALVGAWFVLGAAAVLCLFPALAPVAVWKQAARRYRGILSAAVLPAIAMTAAIPASQALWRPAARVTFSIVAVMLKPFAPQLRTDPTTLTLGTDRFMVTIADVCSGLEGVGLMLIFCIAWLWFFRREYYFPRAFLIIPTALALMFLLNSVRIAALVLIGDAGYPNIAIVGFHSQAGWIAFNAVALAVAGVARRSAWLNRTAVTVQAGAANDNPTAAYLMPLLAILAAGMIAHAASAGFDYFYALRFCAGGAALIYFRKSYAPLVAGASFRAVGAGVAVFLAWMLWDLCFGSAHVMPNALSSLPDSARTTWTVLRVLAAVVTVPIAEELAYRGYLMRVLIGPDFETVPFARVRWPALIVASVAFGAMHGAFWLPGIFAGLLYGLIAIRRNSLAEAIVAHATSNALIAATVLIFGRWELW